jgi:methyl-accepting chemotaxis protein
MKPNPLRTVRTKLLGAFLIIGLLTAGVGGFGLAKLSTLRANSRQISEQVIVPMTKANALYTTFTQWQVDKVGGQQFSGNQIGSTLSDQAAVELAKLPGEVKAIQEVQLPSAASSAAAAEAKTAYDRFTKNLAIPVSSLSGFNKTQIADYLTETLAATNGMVTATIKLVAALQADALKVDAKSASVYHSAEVLMTTVLGVVLAFALVFGLLFADRLVRPIRKTVEVLEDVANGDLTKRLELNRHDELGQMAVALNSTLGTVHDVIRQIESDASGLSQLATRAAEPYGHGGTAGFDDNNRAAEDLASMADNLNAMISIFTLEDAAQPVPA